MTGRGLVALVLLAALVVGSAVAVVHARHENRRLYAELALLEAQRDELNIEFGRLKLEQATWAEPRRIEQVAREALGMDHPTPERTRVLPR